MDKAQYRHYGCRITDEIVYKGLRTLFLENDLLRIGVLLDKGADIFQFLHKPTDTDFLWRSPQGLVPPHQFTPTSAATAGTFLDTYHGGWQEILPGGGPATYRGAELGLHGEVTHLGWNYHILEDTPEGIAVRLQVDCIRTPFRLERTMRLERGTPILFLEEELTNLSPEPQAFMWGHHPAFGAPFLREGVRLFVPATTGQVHSPRFAESGLLEPGAAFKWPFVQTDQKRLDLSQVPGAEAGYAELIYLELTTGWYAVVDPRRRLGIGLAWPVEQFPYLWFWLVYGRAPGYPWWDRVYCIALEPWTSFPNSLDQVLAAGRHAQIQGGDSLTVSLKAIVFTDREQVNKIELDGTIR
jgi:hypothetical protein